MKRIFTLISWIPVLALVFFSGCDQAGQDADNSNVSSTEISWISFEEAQEKMAKNPKKIFSDVFTYWCGPCKRMDQLTFSNPGIVQYVNKNFYAVKFNAQEEKDVVFNGNKFSNPTYDPAKGQMKRNGVHQLSLALGVRAYPTVVFLDENLNLLQAVPGYKTPEQLEPILAYFAEEGYKSTAWDQYVQKFQSRL